MLSIDFKYYQISGKIKFNFDNIIPWFQIKNYFYEEFSVILYKFFIFEFEYWKFLNNSVNKKNKIKEDKNNLEISWNRFKIVLTFLNCFLNFYQYNIINIKIEYVTKEIYLKTYIIKILLSPILFIWNWKIKEFGMLGLIFKVYNFNKIEKQEYLEDIYG